MKFLEVMGLGTTKRRSVYEVNLGK